MGARHLLQSFHAWRAAGEPLVLATVYETAGSTYSKAGHRILLAANGDYRGLVSGGCLEGDLAERARGVIATRASRRRDLRSCAIRPTSSGASASAATACCEFSCSRCCAANDYQPFGAIADCLAGTRRAGVATVIESDEPDSPSGRRPSSTTPASACSAPSDDGRARCCGRGPRRAAERRGAAWRPSRAARILYAPLQPIPKLLVLGGGLDAIPLVGMAAELGWFVTVADHRPGYLARGGFERAERAVLVEPDRLAAALPLDDFDAIVVMSHHLATDRKYLAELAAVDTRYLGVLGPRARRDRLLAELADAAPQLRERLKGPVGLDIGADSPESIALSILAELQATLSTR